jgi:hypothetical protein
MEFSAKASRKALLPSEGRTGGISEQIFQKAELIPFSQYQRPVRYAKERAYVIPLYPAFLF